MMKLPLTYYVFLVASLMTRVAQAETLSGYLIDIQCVNLCEGKAANETCTPDNTNVFYNPQKHTGFCLLLQVCVDSGYVLMSEFPGSDGKHSIVLYMNNNQSQPTVVSYIKAGTSGMFPLVTVEYNQTDSLSQPTAFGVNIRDSWDASKYDSKSPRYQVLCNDETAPDVQKNNLCFQSSISVTETPNNMYLIESHGCPDHANMQGSSGTVTDVTATSRGGRSLLCCAGNSTCSAGCCSASCSSTSTCSGNSTCSAGCCSASSSSTSTGSGCSGITGGSTTCSGTGASSAGCCGSSGGCCGSNGGCCGGSCCTSSGGSSTNGGTHGADGKYNPWFHHYRVMIPTSPGVPGDAKYFAGDKDDVIGILSNGVLLDSHNATWSYDSCNGHTDTKHMYHYHIPPKCFLESLGVSYPTEPFWWKDGDTVRNYDDMGAQWPETGVASPIIGFALDGFPIFGPYDDAGKLQHGKNYGGDVDECNGKADSQGNYGYYLTVDPPFAPPCLRGEKGTFSYYSTGTSCSLDAVETKVFDTSGGVCASVNFAEVLTCVEENPDAVVTVTSDTVDTATTNQTVDGTSGGSYLPRATALAVGAIAAFFQL